MTVSSMTGFARADGAAEGLTWAWEARSVNGRGLDVRLRLPPGFESLEPAAREAVSKRFARGSVSLLLNVDRQSQGGSIRINEQALADVLSAAERIAALTGGPKPTAAELLAVKGVLETGENGVEDPRKRELRDGAILISLKQALDGLAEARRAEGERLGVIIGAQVDEIDRLAASVRQSPSRAPEAIRSRLKEQIARILETADSFDADRLHQEAVLAATRADVEEELARLGAHVAAAREMLGDSGSVGRKLDFLAQEFNREANTLCSKANAVDVTRLGLALKTVIDQLREQVQNVE